MRDRVEMMMGKVGKYERGKFYKGGGEDSEEQSGVMQRAQREQRVKRLGAARKTFGFSSANVFKEALHPLTSLAFSAPISCDTHTLTSPRSTSGFDPINSLSNVKHVDN